MLASAFVLFTLLSQAFAVPANSWRFSTGNSRAREVSNAILGPSILFNGNLEAKAPGSQLFEGFTNHLYFFSKPASDASVANTGTGPTACLSGNGCFVLQMNRNNHDHGRITVQNQLQTTTSPLPMQGPYLVEAYFKCSMKYAADNQARLLMSVDEDENPRPSVAHCQCDGTQDWQYCSFVETFDRGAIPTLNFEFVPSYSPKSYPGLQWLVIDDIALHPLKSRRRKKAL